MIDYYIKCKLSEVDTIRAIGVLLGILFINEEGSYVAHPPHAYHEVGEVRRNDEVIKDGSDQPYWHANLRYAGESLLVHAQSVFDRMEAEGHAIPPELKGKLSSNAWPDLFVVDTNGESTRPTNPAVVWL